MIAGGIVAAIGGLAGLGPIALVSGVLLTWAGIIKVVVLRIWQKTIPPPPSGLIAAESGAVRTALPRLP